MDRVCPLLGLQGDRRTAVDGVDGGHRCHAELPPIVLDRQQQARVCLTDAHERCDRFLAYASRRGGTLPGRSGFVDGLVSTRMILAPEPSWRGITGGARRTRSGPMALIGAGITALGIGSVALATGMLDDPGDPRATDAGLAPVSSEPSATAARSARPSPTEAPTTAPSPSPVMTPVPSAAPTPISAPPPTAAPPAPPQQTYTVQQGDTLAAIAQRFGTTVAALQAANEIEDPNEIIVGQVLVIV